MLSSNESASAAATELARDDALGVGPDLVVPDLDGAARSHAVDPTRIPASDDSPSITARRRAGRRPPGRQPSRTRAPSASSSPARPRGSTPRAARKPAPRRRPGTPPTARTWSTARGPGSRPGYSHISATILRPNSFGKKLSLSTKIGPSTVRSSSAMPVRRVLVVERRCSFENSFRSGRSPATTPARSPCGDPLHRPRADEAAGHRVDLDDEARRSRSCVGKVAGHDGPQLDDRVVALPLHAAGAHDDARARSARGRACRRRTPGGSAPRAGRARARSMAERWWPPATVSFSSTLSASLASAITSRSCWSFLRRVGFVFVATLAPLCS